MLETPEPEFAPQTDRMMRRELTEFDDDFEDLPGPRRRQAGVKVRVRGGLPKSWGGRLAALAAVLVLAGLCAGAMMVAKAAVLHDDRFVIPSSSHVEVQGNSHVTRAQLLSIFGEDVERNIFRVSLDERKAELEQLPWVEHATVMRLLPNHLRVAVIERTPMAFVRQGNHIGLVDANGVLLDMPTDVQASMHYSFPVIIGLAQTDPLSLRAARMKLYARFISDLNSSGEKISEKLSEVDLSDPEDVRSIVADRGGEVMVHFGEDNFLDRYRRFEEHLAEWRTQYPHLSSVDMRYDRQVVLEMQKGSTTLAPAAEATTPAQTMTTGASASGTPTAAKATPTKQAVSKAKTTGPKNTAAAKTTSGATQHQPRPKRTNGESFWVHPKQATAGRATTEPTKGTTPAGHTTEPQ